MGTLNVQATGFSALPSAVTKSYGTFSDADFAKILSWVKATQNNLIQQMFNPGNANPSFVPTNSQLYQVWVQAWINHSIIAQQITTTPSPVPPPPVVIGP